MTAHARTDMPARRRERTQQQRLLRRAEFVARLTDEQLSVLERPPLRPILLRAMALGLPRKFEPAVADGYACVLAIEFEKPGTDSVDRLELVIRDGRARATLGGHAHPDATMRLRVIDLIRLAAGTVEAGWLINDGRIKTSGDMMVFLRFPAMFGLRTRPVLAVHRAPENLID